MTPRQQANQWRQPQTLKWVCPRPLTTLTHAQMLHVEAGLRFEAFANSQRYPR
jgi:hypothetical protein